MTDKLDRKHMSTATFSIKYGSGGQVKDILNKNTVLIGFEEPRLDTETIKKLSEEIKFKNHYLPTCYDLTLNEECKGNFNKKVVGNHTYPHWFKGCKL